jgi:hypothetical protein
MIAEKSVVQLVGQAEIVFDDNMSMSVVFESPRHQRKFDLSDKWHLRDLCIAEFGSVNNSFGNGEVLEQIQDLQILFRERDEKARNNQDYAMFALLMMQESALLQGMSQWLKENELSRQDLYS